MSDPQSIEPVSVGPGSLLGGKYRVEKIIGHGGMGIVVAARHVTMSHRVAIKVLNLDGETNREDAIARFVREARAAARIESNHVVRVTDVESLDDGTPYMVMEFLEGEDFRRIIHERGQLPIAEAVGYVLEACEGLSEAHAAGVIHRDLKPSNLFLAKKANGTTVVKVVDFGISKVASRPGEVAITTTNSLMGSPMYMAPEQMRSSREVDSRADVWSMGLILYELLAAEAPFSGDTIPEVCVAVMGADPEAISHYRDDVPQELQAILVKCMAKDRTERYPTMAALARDLVRFADADARVHADRASAALKAARTEVETQPEVDVPLSTNRGARPAMSPSSRRDPETLKSWSTARKGTGGSKRAAWIALAALAAVVAAAVGARLALAPSERVSATIVAPSATPTESATRIPLPPPTSNDLASVPVDSLPMVERDASVPRAPRAIVPAPPPAPTAKTTASASPAPSSSTPAPKKDDWKWGDRN